MSRLHTSTMSLIATRVGCAVAVTWSWACGFAQTPPAPQRAPAVRIRAAIGGAIAAPEVNRPTTPPLPSSAVVNTNEDLERLLDRADQLVASGRSDLAPVLWQRVLDEAGDVLASAAGGQSETRRHIYQSYRPLREEVLRRMTTAGAEALKAYRLQMDGVAKVRLLDPSIDHEVALAEVVQRLLLTTAGPQAAFELACLRLEQGDYLSAIRLLSAVEQVPDHTVSPAALTARMIAALARLGAGDAARERLEQDAALSPEIRVLLASDLLHWGTPSASPLETTSEVRPTSRDGVLSEAWRETLPYLLKAAAPQPPGANTRVVIANMNGRRVALQMDNNGRLMQPTANNANARDLKPEELYRTWADAKWQPVGRAQIVGDRVLLKSQERLLCLNLDTGRTTWMGRRTTYPHAPESVQTWQWQMMGAARTAADGIRRPQTLTEVTLFGDRVPQLFAVHEDLVFNVEGPLSYSVSTTTVEPAAPPAAVNPFAFIPPALEAARKTWLSAYELRTGKLRWYRAANDDNDAAASGFVSVPVPHQGGLIVATSDGQRLALLALDRLTGVTRWRTTLCDIPPPGMSPWSPVGVAVERGEVFVSTGAGIVFVVDGLDGSVRQAVTYPRKSSSLIAGHNAQVMIEGDIRFPVSSRGECSENLAIPYETAVVVLATDSDHIFAIDRRTAGLLWEAPLVPQLRSDPGLHCLGRTGRMLIIAGARAVRGYDLAGGRIVWETPLAGSFGRGTVTESAVTIPEDHRIITLDPQTGATLSRHTLIPTDGAPVGNLLLAGDRIVILGAGTASLWNHIPPPNDEGTKP